MVSVEELKKVDEEGKTLVKYGHGSSNRLDMIKLLIYVLSGKEDNLYGLSLDQDDKGYWVASWRLKETKIVETFKPFEYDDALEGSIRKWEGILRGDTEDLLSLNCPLCKKYLGQGNCFGCPVQIRTGQRGCISTPYILWNEHQHTHYQYKGRYTHCEKCIQLAQQELDFLRGLRKPKETKMEKIGVYFPYNEPSGDAEIGGTCAHCFGREYNELNGYCLNTCVFRCNCKEVLKLLIGRK